MALTRPRYSQIYDTDYKQSVRVATTADVGNLLATGNMTNSIDGKTLALNDRILVKDQSDAKQNGIYRVATVGTGSNGTWVRALDADASDKVTSGMTTTVAEGDTHISKTFKLSTPDPITLGVTELTFVNPFVAGSAAGGNTHVQFNDGGIAGASAGLTFNKTGNVLSVGGNIYVTGSILPSANVTYDLGSPTQRWREGWFSGSTIHIGAESISVDNNGKWTFTSDGAAVELGKNNEFNPPSANISGNVTATNYLFANGTLLMTVVDTMIGTANTGMQGHVAEQISTANVNLKGYVDAANTIQSNQIAGANSAVTTANTNMKGYVDGQISTTSGAATTANTNMKGYVDGQISTTSSSVTTANTNMKGYVDGQISTTTTAITTANTNLKGYVDGQITNLVGGSPATLDTLNEIAVALGNDANLSVTLTSLITGVQGNITAANSAITTANTNMKGYTDNLVSTANVNLKGYVDGQISTTSSSITTANTNMKGYVDNGLSSLSSNRINANASNVIVTASYVNVAINSTNVASFSSAGINIAGDILVPTYGGAYNNHLTFQSATASDNTVIQVAPSTGGSYGQIGLSNAADLTNASVLELTSNSTWTRIESGRHGSGTPLPLDIYVGGNQQVLIDLGGNIAMGSPTAYSNVKVGHTTPSTSTTSGALQVAGGVGIVGNVNAGNVGATNLTGTILTAAQPSITSVGTLTSLTVSGVSLLGGYSQIGGSSSFVGIKYPGGGTQYGIGLQPTADSTNAMTFFNAAGTVLGAISQTVNTLTFSGTASTAKYADLAEVYTSDRNYIPGTVLVFGGAQEVTVSTLSHDPSVAGVVSTNPAYLMNDTVDGVAVALQGRVPCRVQGPVKKGDRVVASDIRGVAQRLDPAYYQPGCIIGKSLEYVPEGEIATIEVVVGRN